MLKKLSQEKINDILEAGIRQFAAHGPDGVGMNAIAQASGVSVGVLYKYYQSKDAFFLACLRHSVDALKAAVNSALAGEMTVMERAGVLIRALQQSVREHPEHHVLYHEVTAGGCRRFAHMLAGEIEGVTSSVYTAMLRDAMREGRLRQDMDPRYFAFCFDNLLMMLQFSYTCDYYRERLRIYCGEEALTDDERMAGELTRFLAGAFYAGMGPAAQK